MSPETVRYWSDYNRVFYHPRSIIQLNEYGISSSLLPFEKYETGEELFANIDREEDVLDRDLRPWAEECDHMQGIQVVTGADDAWAGFASKYMERLRDEYGKMGLWVWGIGEEQGKDLRAKQASRAINAARMVGEVSTNASIYVPMSLPARPVPDYLRPDRGSQWHTSALLSAAFETMTLPSRLRPDGQRPRLLDDIEAALNVNGNQHIAQLQCSALGPDSADSVAKAPQERDTRMRSDSDYPLLEEDEEQNANADLDIDLSASQASSSKPGSHSDHIHVFGGFECLRGKLDSHDEDSDGDEVAYSKKRRRFAGMPIIERWPLYTDPSIQEYPGLTSVIDATPRWRFQFSTASLLSLLMPQIAKSACGLRYRPRLEHQSESRNFRRLVYAL